MERAEILASVESIFRRAGFNVSALCCSRPSCFDYVASKGSRKLFVKTYTNICGISEKDAFEIKKLSRHFSAVPLFVGERVREKLLEDDTVYSRYGVYAVTLKTLEDIVQKGVYPLIEAGPGGYYVRLDGEAIRKRRQEMGLSVGKLAEMIGVSRRTLYGYENGMAKASVSVAYNLAWILGVPVVKPINIFEEKQGQRKRTSFLTSAREAIIKNPLLRALVQKFTQHNFKILHVRKAPFDFVAELSKERLTVLGGIASRRETNLSKRVEEMVSISRIVDAQPMLITDDKTVLAENSAVPMFHEGEFLRLDNIEEVIARI